MIELSRWRVIETGVHHYPRLHGRSQFFRGRALFRTFRELMKLYWKIVLFAPRHARAREAA
jgi:hypothetical protein